MPHGDTSIITESQKLARHGNAAVPALTSHVCVCVCECVCTGMRMWVCVSVCVMCVGLGGCSEHCPSAQQDLEGLILTRRNSFASGIAHLSASPLD